MILKMNNKAENFYSIMGSFFGSRIVQNATNDRMFDDNKKEWYINFNDDTPTAFLSVSNDIIKNIYSSKDEDLASLLNYVKKELKIKDSIVTNAYLDIYNQCNFVIVDSDYKNFVKIRGDAK